MNFEQVIAGISSTLEMGGFLITEHRINYAKFQSKLISLVISYSPLEYSYSVFAGRKEGEMNELTDKVYLNVFGLNFQQVNRLTFAERFTYFLNNGGRPIVENDMAKVEELEAYCKRASKEYTDAIINRQNLEAADRAWSENNYRDFINHLNKVVVHALPKSYRLKKEIALQKIGQNA